MEEYWKPVEGYEGLYEVSNEGRVRSLNYNKTGETKILRPLMIGGGYLQVQLWKDGKVKMLLVHRLVAITFIPNPDNLPQVNHKNEDKTDNRVVNLEWTTAIENSNYGTRNRRISEALSKPVLQFSKIGRFIQEWSSANEVERVLGFQHSHIAECCNEKLKSYKGYIWKYK